MAKVIYVDFRNGSKVAFKDGDDGPLTLIQSNPYLDHSNYDLLQESARFIRALDNAGGYISAEMCRWGIPLYEALAIKAVTPEYKQYATSMARELSRTLDQINNQAPVPPSGA